MIFAPCVVIAGVVPSDICPMCCHCRCGRMLHLMCCHCRYSAMYCLPHVFLQGWYHKVLASCVVITDVVPCDTCIISGVVPSDTQCVVIADVVSGNTHVILSLQVIVILCCHYGCCTRLYSFHIAITGVVPGYYSFHLSLQVWYQVFHVITGVVPGYYSFHLSLQVWYQVFHVVITGVVPANTHSICHYRCGTRYSMLLLQVWY